MRGATRFTEAARLVTQARGYRNEYECFMQCNRDQLAELLGRDVKTIDRMVAQGMPYVKRPARASGGRVWEFDTAACWRWMTGEDIQDHIKEANRRLAIARATLSEIELGEKQGVLIHIQDVVGRVSGGDAIVKSRLMAMPGRQAHIAAAEGMLHRRGGHPTAALP